MTNDFFTNIPDYSGIGIYALINNRTGKMYIGASQNIHQRIMQHKYHPLRAIKDDIELGDTFRVEILEKLPSGSNQFDMFGREKYFIDLYDVIKHGYNKAPTTCCPKEDLLKTLEHCTPNTQMATYTGTKAGNCSRQAARRGASGGTCPHRCGVNAGGAAA